MRGGYCYNAIFPQQKLAIVVLTNGGIESEQGKPETLARRIFEAYVPPNALKDDPAITALARKTLRGFQTGDVDRADLTPGFAAFITPAVAAQAQTAWASLGEARSFTLTGSSTSQGATQYVYRVEFPGGAVESAYIFIRDGKVAGFTMH